MKHLDCRIKTYGSVDGSSETYYCVYGKSGTEYYDEKGIFRFLFNILKNGKKWKMEDESVDKEIYRACYYDKLTVDTFVENINSFYLYLTFMIIAVALIFGTLAVFNHFNIVKVKSGWLCILLAISICVSIVLSFIFSEMEKVFKR